jgi:hypothetical protein
VQKGSALDRLVAPWPLLLGVLASFLGCCALGAWYGRRPVYENFERFHPYIAPESLHYPTSTQVLALARSRLPADKVAVIVGGNSILYGVGQRNGLLWSKALQAELGDDYRVLNLAMRGASASEFGGTVAEVLGREGRKVIFITIANYGAPGSPDGNLYQYFYWDACSRGLLPRWQPREALIERTDRQRDREKVAELRRRTQFNSYCGFCDLWNAVAYQRLSTVWTALVAEHPFRPRKRWGYEDPGPAIPFAVRYAPASTPLILTRARSWIATCRGLLPYKGGGPEIDLDRSDTVLQLRACFPEDCRARTLLLIPHENPYYLAQLSPAEQALSRQYALEQVRAAEGVGLAALAVGRDFTVEDCYDGGGHYSESGGLKLAGAVAPKVREMAARLGYLEKEGTR